MSTKKSHIEIKLIGSQCWSMMANDKYEKTPKTIADLVILKYNKLSLFQERFCDTKLICGGLIDYIIFRKTFLLSLFFVEKKNDYC